jgi:hypothetical protein
MLLGESHILYQYSTATVRLFQKSTYQDEQNLQRVRLYSAQCLVSFTYQSCIEHILKNCELRFEMKYNEKKSAGAYRSAVLPGWVIV